MNRQDRRQRITEYDNQIRNLEATRTYVTEKLADAELDAAFWRDLENEFATDITQLKQQRETLTTEFGKLPGLAYTAVNKKRVNRPKKRQPKTHRKNGTPVTKDRPPNNRKGVRRRAV